MTENNQPQQQDLNSNITIPTPTEITHRIAVDSQSIKFRDYSPKPVNLNLKINSNGMLSKKRNSK